MRQEGKHLAPVRDEIIVDEIDRAVDAAGQKLIEFRDHLIRRFKARNPAVEAWNIAEFAPIGTAARKLNAAEEIAPDLGEFIGGHREIAKVAAGLRCQHDLFAPAPNVAAEASDQWPGRIGEFAA